MSKELEMVLENLHDEIDCEINKTSKFNVDDRSHINAF